MFLVMLLMPATTIFPFIQRCFADDVAANCEFVNKALNFIEERFNDSVGLCSGYPNSSTYWVYNDNYLACEILNYFGRNKTAQRINQTIQKYNISVNGNDRMEVLFNKRIPFPPYTGTGPDFSPIVNSTMELGRNLVNNSDVEKEDGVGWPDGWHHALEGIEWTNETSHSQSHSLKIIGNASKPTDWRSYVFNVNGSKNYLFKCWIKGDASGEWFITIRWLNKYVIHPTESDIINFINIPLGNRTWTDWTEIYGFNLTSPENAVATDVVFWSNNATGIMYADDFEFKEIQNFGSFIVRNDVKHIWIDNWKDYADLLLFGIIEEHYQNDLEYKQLWNEACEMFDGKGMVDKSFNDSFTETGIKKYDTYELALFVITSKIIGNETLATSCAFHILWSIRNKTNGGITTHYLADLSPDPDAKQNVETTCLAVYSVLPREETPIPEFESPMSVLFIAVITLTCLVASKKKLLTKLRDVK